MSSCLRKKRQVNFPGAADISRIKAVRNGLRIMSTRGYTSLKEITDTDVSSIPAEEKGADTLDGALCSLGVFTRTPKRGTTRKSRLERLSPDQMLRIGKDSRALPSSDDPLSGNLFHAHQ